MLKRLHIYLAEMYPVLPRLLISFAFFGVVYLLVLLGTNTRPAGIGGGEIAGSVTVFGFLMALRIIDEFKDAKTDLVNFPNRPLPSGRVKRSDLITLLVVDVALMIAVNILWMNNLWFFLVLLAYGALMSKWFFARKYIQPSLILALLTHNPVQLILVFYVISFACIKYGLPVFSASTVLIALTFYLPGLTWELSRKIRAPRDENQYVTYSEIFGLRPAVLIVMVVAALQAWGTVAVITPLSPVAAAAVMVNFTVLIGGSIIYLHDPERFIFGSLARWNIYIAQFIIAAMELAVLYGRYYA